MTIKQEIVDDWLAANKVLTEMLQESFGVNNWVDYERFAMAFQARLTYLDPPLVVARMDRVKGDDTVFQDTLPAEQPR